MPKYKTKPVEKEAFQFQGNLKQNYPRWFEHAKIDSTVYLRWVSDQDDIDCIIKTMEGKMIAKKGDYIIQGLMGEIYPCKAEVFERTYELIEG